MQLQEDNYSQEQRKQKPWKDTKTQTESKVPSEEETQNLQQQLQQQLREQKQLRQRINCLFEQLIKTQQGVHIDPSLVYAPKPNCSQRGSPKPTPRETGKQRIRPAELLSKPLEATCQSP